MGIGALSYQRVEPVNTNETTENFLKAMQSFRWPEPVKVFYRLYHDDKGQPLFYTMEDLPGAYIEVDQSTYVTASHSVKVANGRLIHIESQPRTSKLKPCATDGVCCDPRDVCIVVGSEGSNQQWRFDRNDQD